MTAEANPNTPEFLVAKLREIQAPPYCQIAADLIERLTRERDEAAENARLREALCKISVSVDAEKAREIASAAVVPRSDEQEEDNGCHRLDGPAGPDCPWGEACCRADVRLRALVAPDLKKRLRASAKHMQDFSWTVGNDERLKAASAMAEAADALSELLAAGEAGHE
jgi:hypothetical protein